MKLKKMTLEQVEKRNIWLQRLAFVGDTLVSYVTAPFAAARKVREDIANPDKIDEPIKFWDSYKRYFRAHTDANNGCRLLMSAHDITNARIDKWQQLQPLKYTPTIEISAKGLESVLYTLSENSVIDVRYFDQTEHQSHTPMRCSFGDYTIDFASAGTTWCGGGQGNGYVFRRDTKGNKEQIAVISSELSNYLAEIADEKFRMQQMSRSR